MKNVLIIFTVLFLVLHSCDNPKKIKSAIVAKIDERVVTLDELRSFYTFDVNFGLDSSGIAALKDELLFYIDQILAQKKAASEGLLADPVFVKSIEWEKRQAMLRQLYRQKITDNIIVTDKETRDLYRKGQVQVRFRHLFFKSLDEARQARMELDKGKTFKDIALKIFRDDSLAKSGGQLDWIKLSDLDEQLSDSIYTMPVKTISHPLRSKWGYHIVEVLDKKENPIITESDYLKSLPSLEKKVKMQKSQNLSLKYIYNYVGELNPQLDAKMFAKFWKAVIPLNEQERHVLSAKTELTQSEINKLRTVLRVELNQPFIVYQGGAVSLGEFLKGVEKIPVSHSFTFQSRRELSNQIGRWIRDELLIKEALRENLDNNARVIGETNRFIEEQSYYYYQSFISDTMAVPEYIADFYSQKDSTIASNDPLLNKYHTLQDWKFERSKRLLHNYLKTIKSDIFIDDQLLQKENKEVNWDNKIRMFMIRKPS